ncbi:MAG: hypothetical protein HYW05_00010 [Candidatus Diapherotrites archaeon]|nr:hypothetical protein [Candidatus Diapherotrites archaeon]
MDTAFKMLVSAIAAIALIMVLLNYILPYFLQTQDVEREIGVLLTEAEFSPGKYKSASIQLTSGANLRAENFDSDNRSVAFSCNSAELCLDYISYDEREMKVKRNILTTASARCAYAHDLFTCKIYFGKEPAQLEIREAQVKESIDLGKSENIAKFVVKNTGDVEARNVKATAKIYRRYFADFEWKKEFVRQNEKTLGNIDAGAGLNAEIELLIGESGNYAVEIIASAEDAGFDSAEKTFEAIGAINLCNATTQEGYATYNSESDKCRRKSFCNSCTYAFECRDAWKVKSAGKTFESAEPGFAYEIREAFDGICMVTELS